MFDASFLTESDYVAYAAKSMRANHLFVDGTVAQIIVEIEGAHSWFSKTLELVRVEPRACILADCATGKAGVLRYAVDVLSRLDVGIVDFITEGVHCRRARVFRRPSRSSRRTIFS